MEQKSMNIIGVGDAQEHLTTTIDKIIHAMANLNPGDPFFFMSMPKKSDNISFIGAMAAEDFLTALEVLRVACDGVIEANQQIDGQNQETMQ